MSHLSASVLMLAALALPVQDQNAAALSSSRPTEYAPEVNSGTTATVPQQMRRADPPSESASVQELEDRGDELRANRMYADAADYYRVALRKANTARLHNKLGMAHLQMMRQDEAKKEFERSLKLDKNYAEAHNNLGVIFYIRKDYSRAVREYQKAIDLAAFSASFHSNLATAYFSRKEYDKALNEYSRAFQLDPEIFERTSPGGVSAHIIDNRERGRYEYVIAKMYAQANNSDRCLLYLRKALEDGYSGINEVYKDAEFANIRKDPRFNELMANRPPALVIN